MTKDEFAAICRDLREKGVPISEHGHVWPIEGRTKEQEWAAIREYEPVIFELMNGKPKSLDKSPVLERSSRSFRALHLERPWDMNDKGKFKEVKYESAGGDVTITGSGEIKMSPKSGSMSAEEAQGYAVSIQNAVNQVRAGGLTLAKNSESNPETYKSLDAMNDKKAEEKKDDKKPSDLLPADNATKPGDVPPNTSPNTVPNQRVELAKVQSRDTGAKKVDVKDAAKNNGARSAASQAKGKK